MLIPKNAEILHPGHFPTLWQLPGMVNLNIPWVPLHRPEESDAPTMWQVGTDFKARTAAAVGKKEQSIMPAPTLAVVRNEEKVTLNRCGSCQE